MDEMKPVELTDEQLDDVAGGYDPYKRYQKDETIDWFCSDCNKPTTHICTSPTTVKTKDLRGWIYETTWVCTVCGRGVPLVAEKRRV